MKRMNQELPSSGRDRLLETARNLFTRCGASNVGINDVTGLAGVAKMTLYNNFASKEALVLAVYREMVESTLRELRELSPTGLSEEERIHAILDYLDRKAHRAGYRGCPFIHVSLQAAEPSGPILTLVRSYKRALREHVVGLLDNGRENRADLADQIVILLDGAVTEGYLKGVQDPIGSAKRAATMLLNFTG